MKKAVLCVILLVAIIASLSACRWRCRLYDWDDDIYIGTEYYTAWTEDQAVEQCESENNYWWLSCYCYKD